MVKAELVSMFEERQPPPEEDVLGATALAQAELQKKKCLNLFGGAGQHIVSLLAGL